MGECGCSIEKVEAKLPAPGGYYLLKRYPGCDNCGTSAGLEIMRVNDNVVGKDFIAASCGFQSAYAVPDLAMTNATAGVQMTFIPLLNPEALKDAIIAFHGDDVEGAWDGQEVETAVRATISAESLA